MFNSPIRAYVASSWRNAYQPDLIKRIVEKFPVLQPYDFRHPDGPESRGFSWSELDPEWRNWHPADFREMLEHPIAQHGYYRDYNGMNCDLGILVLPSGRSAHLEAGVLIGSGRPCAIHIPEPIEPDLMYLLAETTNLCSHSSITVNDEELDFWLTSTIAAIQTRRRDAIDWSEKKKKPNPVRAIYTYDGGYVNPDDVAGVVATGFKIYLILKSGREVLFISISDEERRGNVYRNISGIIGSKESGIHEAQALLMSAGRG